MAVNQSPQLSNCIIVLGSARSGTSMTAGLLSILGVDMGNVRPSDPMNARGYFEDFDFLKIISSIFQESEPGSDGFSPPAHEKIMAAGAQYEERINMLLHKRYNDANGGLWGWKSPTTCFVAELVLPHLVEPRIIIVLRHPLDIANSIVEYTSSRWKSYKPLSQIQALEIANKFYGRIYEVCHSHAHLNVHIVSYEDIVSDTRRELAGIADYLGVTPTTLQLRNAEKYVVGKKGMKLSKAKINAIEVTKDFLRGRYRAIMRLLGKTSVATKK